MEPVMSKAARDLERARNLAIKWGEPEMAVRIDRLLQSELEREQVAR